MKKKKMMNKITKHINKWNVWRRYNANGKIYKLLVLIGLVHSPTFSICLTKEELAEIGKAFNDGFKEGFKGYEIR